MWRSFGGLSVGREKEVIGGKGAGIKKYNWGWGKTVSLDGHLGLIFLKSEKYFASSITFTYSLRSCHTHFQFLSSDHEINSNLLWPITSHWKNSIAIHY